MDIDFPEDEESRVTCESLWEMDWHENIVRDLISLHKFKRLGVTFADHHLQDLLQLPDDKLSCVEDLRFRYISLNEDNTTSPLDLYKLSNLTSFSLLPNPFEFESHNGPLEGYSRFSGIPWHNLRHVQLCATMPVSFCLDALEQCSALLETCSLIIHADHSFKLSPRVPVHLSQLRELEVDVHSSTFSDEGILGFFLPSLRFPMLKPLTLRSSRYLILCGDLQMLFMAQNASQTHLEELIISNLTLLSIDVRTLLIAFPSLRRLELPNAVTFTEDAMAEVGAGSIGASLEDLTIRESGLNLETLLQMVQLRSRAGIKARKHDGIEVTEFKSVTLYCNNGGEDLEGEVYNLIVVIGLLGIDLNVFFEDPYHDYSSDDSD